MGVLAAAGDVFDVGAAGKGAAGVSHGVSGILQSARRGAASDAASDMAGLLWQQWMLGENAELSQMRRAMLAAGLTEEEAAFQMGMALASRFGTDAAEGAITAGMSDALGRGVRGAKNLFENGGIGAAAHRGWNAVSDAADAVGDTVNSWRAQQRHPWEAKLPDGVVLRGEDVPAGQRQPLVRDSTLTFEQWIDKYGLSDNNRGEANASAAAQPGKSSISIDIPVCDESGRQVGTVHVTTKTLPKVLKDIKPLGSPQPKRWYEKNGSMLVQNINGKPTLIYINAEGTAVPYPDGWVDFKAAGGVSGEYDIGAFQERSHDKIAANQMRGRALIVEEEIGHHAHTTMQDVRTDWHKQFTHYGGNYDAHRAKKRKKF